MYKKTKKVEKLEEDIQEFLNYMKLGGKKPDNIYLTRKQADILIEDKNKKAKDLDKYAKEITEVNEIFGYPIKLYG